MENRMSLSNDLLSLIEGLSTDQYDRIITGDESWFFFDTPHESAWAESRDSLPSIPNQGFQSKKVLISIIWTVTGIISLTALEKGTKYDSAYFCDVVFPSIESELLSRGRRKTLKGFYLHLDNAPAHNSKRSTSKIMESRMCRAPHPAYSPDIAPSDFFLLGYIKQKLKGEAFHDTESLLMRICDIFAEMKKGLLVSVYKEWVGRLKWVINHGGMYYPS
jgi:histone-lysine N-methyltransferase SETMAR